MTRNHLYTMGLFLASFAAFSLAFGHPHVVLAAPEGADPSAVGKVMDTKEGKAALAKAGVSAEKFKAMLARLSPEQRGKLEEMVKGLTSKARLCARMLASGYTQAQVDERLALLTDDEIARLAADPDAMTAGAGVNTLFLIVLLVLVALLVCWYFVAIEEPTAPETPAELAPPPAE